MAFGKDLLVLLAKVVSDKFIGKERTDEVAQLIRRLRSQGQAATDEELTALRREAVDPAHLRQAASEAAEAIQDANKGLLTASEDLTQAVELTLAEAIPEAVEDLSRLVADCSPAEEAAKQFVEEKLPKPKKGRYVVWLEPPLINGEGRYCHFSYEFNQRTRQFSFCVRDYLGHTIYEVVQRPTNPDAKHWKKVVDWRGRHTALEVWHAAQDKIPCTPTQGRRLGVSDPEGNNRGLAIPTKKFDIWKDILEKLRRRSSAQAPGRASVPKSRAMPAAETETLDQLLAERDALRKQVAEQQAKLAEAEAERDGYRRSALALLPKDEPLFSEEVLQEMKRTAVPLEDFIQELEQAPGKGTADDAGA